MPNGEGTYGLPSNIASRGRMYDPKERFVKGFLEDPMSVFRKKDEGAQNPRVKRVEQISGTTYGTEEYYQWLEEHPAFNIFGAAEKLDKYSPDPYRVSEETQQIYEKSQESADIIRSQAEEATKAAEIQRGMVEAPGSGLRREAAEESTAAAVAQTQQAGGASASALGAIANIQSGDISSMRDAAIQTQVFRDQAEKEYMQALQDQGGAEVSAMQTEIGGLQALGAAKEQQYQTNIVDPFYARQEAELAMAAAKAAKPDDKFLGIF